MTEEEWRLLAADAMHSDAWDIKVEGLCKRVCAWAILHHLEATSASQAMRALRRLWAIDDASLNSQDKFSGRTLKRWLNGEAIRTANAIFRAAAVVPEIHELSRHSVWKLLRYWHWHMHPSEIYESMSSLPPETRTLVLDYDHPRRGYFRLKQPRSYPLGKLSALASTDGLVALLLLLHETSQFKWKTLNAQIATQAMLATQRLCATEPFIHVREDFTGCLKCYISMLTLTKAKRDF